MPLISIINSLTKKQKMLIITIVTSDGAEKLIRVKNNDIQTYLDGLPPKNIKGINVSKCELTHIPNLSRFTNLIELNCSENHLSSLPELPKSLADLNCRSNQLTSLPTLPESLLFLHCGDNQLTFLPALPKNLESLRCYGNQLASLPSLPKSLAELLCKDNRLTILPSLLENLKIVYCNNNHLNSLPELPKSLIALECSNNQISGILKDLSVNSRDKPLVRRTINKLNRFKHLYYCLRFKLKFIQWFLRANERKIMEQNHPDKITALLASGVDVLEL